MRHWFAIIIVVVFLTGATSPISTQAQSREQLESDLANLEAQINALNLSIAQKKNQGASIKNDIAVLAQKIAQSKLKIKAHDAAISKLNQNITEKNRTINVLNVKMGREKDSLAQIMRKTQYMEQYSLLDFSLQSQSLSTFFSDVDSFNTLNRALSESFKEIDATKKELEGVKVQLEEDKDAEQQKKLAQEAEKKNVEVNQSQKNKLLTITKNEEVEYGKVLADREKEAAQIRARLFDLRDTTSISFGQAYDFALAASKITGVRPALILAILMQESSLGINVGACYLNGDLSGNGFSIKTGDVKPRTMSPTRDVPVFVRILSKLGRELTRTPVSCWIAYYSKGDPIGWGGAMGPSQFIPSTWELFESRIEKVTGASKADPWNPYHAITATSLYLEDLGAVAGNESSERNAACRYYSGRSCASTSAGASYGNSVMKKLYSVQADIDKLQR